MTATAERKRRLPSPGTMLLIAILLIVAAMYLSFGRMFLTNLRVVHKMEAADAYVQFSEGSPKWLRDSLSEDLRKGIDPIISVCLFPRPGRGPVIREIVSDIQDRRSILGVQLDLTDEELVRVDFPELSSLNLFGSATDAGAVQLHRFPKLMSLNLQDSLMTDAAVVEIAKIANLERLEFDSCPLIGDAAIEHLKAHSRLQSLRISSCPGISDEALRHAARIPSLRDLAIQLAPKVSDAGIASLAESSLVSLSIHELPGVSGEGLGELRRCASLRYLHLSGSSYGDEVIPFLSQLSQLTTIDLYRTSVTPTAAEQLRDSLPTCEVELRNDEPNQAIISPRR